MKSFNYISPLHCIIILITIVFMLLGPLIGYFSNDKVFLVVSIIIWVSLSCILLYTCFFKKIKIGFDGVTFRTLSKKYHLNWDEIKVIGIGYQRGAVFTYFSSEYENWNYVDSKMISEKFIMIGYRKCVIREIRKYWEGRIEGEHIKKN